MCYEMMTWSCIISPSILHIVSSYVYLANVYLPHVFVVAYLVTEFLCVIFLFIKDFCQDNQNRKSSGIRMHNQRRKISEY